MPLKLSSNGILQSLHSDSTYGALQERDTQLLDLFSQEGIDFELLWVPARAQKGSKTDKKAAVWATIYGLRELASGLRDLFHDLDLYLQDPIHSLRDVTYFNPQRFFNDPEIRTSNFQVTSLNQEQISTVKDEDLVVTDVLNGITAESILHETPGSLYLLTELLRSGDRITSVRTKQKLIEPSHQKQGLTFMIRRESGWRLYEKCQDVWSQANDNLGCLTYVCP